MLKISILGSGSLGCAMATIYEKQGYDITLWSHSKQEADDIKTYSENKHYLPNIKIPKTIHVTSEINNVFDSDIILIIVPSFAVKTTINLIKGNIAPHTIIVCLSKGLEETNLDLFSNIIEKTFVSNQSAVLLGPSHAEEIAKNVVTAMVVSSKNTDTAEYLQKILTTPTIRVYINNDIIGVQIGAALKNIIALATGICNGMKLGDNTKAALMTRGLHEIVNLGIALGAKKETFLGLTGVGDLIVTCISVHSRNMQTGFLIGQGMKTEKAIEKVGVTVEGYTCTKYAYALSLKTNVETPIISEMYNILYKNKNVHQAIDDLLKRPFKKE